MKKVLYLILCFVASTQLLATELDTWTHYFAYNKLTHVVPTPNYVFAVSAGRLFSYASGKAVDSQIYAYNTTNLLSDHNDIQDILYVQATNTLFIVYEGGNIDLLDIAKSKITNISYIKDYNTTHSKNILDVCCNGKDVYVTMPWTIIIINTQKKEVVENYVITEDDSEYNTIFGSIVQGDSIYVVSSANYIEGFNNSIIRGNINSNLRDKKNWSDSFSKDRKDAVLTAVKDAKQSRNIYTLSNANTKNDKLIADTYRDCYWGSNSDNLLMEYNKEGTQYEPASDKAIKPAGPASNDFRTIYWKYNKLYTVGGTWTRFDDTWKSNAIQIMQHKAGKAQWQQYNTDVSAISNNNMYGAADITIDPRDTSHVMVASRSGLFEYRKGEIVNVWNYTNSPIKGLGDGATLSFQMILGAQYDSKGNLYVLNSACSNGLLCLNSNGEWKTFNSTYLDNFENNAQFLSNICFDNDGSLWFINQNWENSCFYKFDTWMETFTKYNISKNQDSTPLYPLYKHLRDIGVDMEGNVWACGNDGLIYKPYDKTNTDFTYQYKVNRNDGTGLADYLLSTVNASCIIFDSANRMYVGTSDNGVYVISADRNTEVQHYTTENSFLMNDNIFGLAIDDATGELYISTEKGLCSVHTDAIQVPEELAKSNIVVYPNPVTPEYTGPITIEGLTVGANIVITNAAGAVVHRGRSTSAMYQWDGCDINGDRCASGIYNILLAGQDGSKGCIGKIAMVK